LIVKDISVKENGSIYEVSLYSKNVYTGTQSNTYEHLVVEYNRYNLDFYVIGVSVISD